jgi:hypothetical protein
MSPIFVEPPPLFICYRFKGRSAMSNTLGPKINGASPGEGHRLLPAAHRISAANAAFRPTAS